MPGAKRRIERGNAFRVEVQGLRQFARELRAIDPAVAKQLQQANKRAADTVAQVARSQYERHYTVRRGRTQRSIRALATANRAQIALGGARVPWALGQEFGSHRFPQFRPWTGPAPSGRGSYGRFFYPAAREEADRLVETYRGILEDEFHPVFPEPV